MARVIQVQVRGGDRYTYRTEDESIHVDDNVVVESYAGSRYLITGIVKNNDTGQDASDGSLKWVVDRINTEAHDERKRIQREGD